jgi:1-acyl-sn-glycerol-3-phosphate acyltransferase
MVLIGAPHTSNWDFVVALATAFALGLEIHWLGKHTLFRPPVGPLMRWLGGIPVDRRVRSGVVSQSVEAIRSRDQMLLCIAPEGTRGRVRRWKTGFYHIARETGLPILLCHLNNPRRILGFGPTFRPGNDTDADLAAIRAHYERFRGRRGVRETDTGES